jgi:hypothetical protein
MASCLPICLVLVVVASGGLATGQFEGWGLQRLVVGKAANRRQSVTSQLSLLNYHFFAEILVRKHPCLSNASLICPVAGSQPIRFPTTASLDREIHGGRYSSEQELDAAFPDGEYEFRFNTTGGKPSSESTKLEKLRSTDYIPKPISITLLQNGRIVQPPKVSPGIDLLVSWSRFSNGGEDPNGICPDLIFFAMGDCFGNALLNSGEPFSNSTSLLTYRNTSFRVPSPFLKPGRTYQLSVEQSKKVTSRDSLTGVRALPCFETTTYLDFNTTGTGAVQDGLLACPYPPYQMDPGQTDRSPPPEVYATLLM